MSSGCTDASFNVNGCTAGPACTSGHFCTGGSQCTSLENYCTYGYCTSGTGCTGGQYCSDGAVCTKGTCTRGAHPNVCTSGASCDYTESNCDS
jgi:hypothetical protein